MNLTYIFFLLTAQKYFLVLNINLLKKILNKFNGLHYKQEYLCLANESFTQPLHGYLTGNKKVIKDITKLHSFVGYSPVAFAFVPGSIPGDEMIEIVFSHKIYQPAELLSKKHLLARLEMKNISQFITSEGVVFIYEGVKGNHLFIPGFNQLFIQLNNWLYNRKPGNVYLKGNLYKQVQLAYAIPRKICLITVCNGDLYNHFPTDLHGQVTEQHYLISLRHEGNACKQVEAAKKIVLSDIDATAYKQVYALGKNHMQPLKDRSVFNFAAIHSKNFQLPLAQNLLWYKELELQDAFICGIHKLLLFRIVFQEQVNGEATALMHIHNSYATWRFTHGFSGNYLLR